LIYFDPSKLAKRPLLGRQANFLQSFNSSIPIGKLLIRLDFSPSAPDQRLKKVASLRVTMQIETLFCSGAPD
jgi:hypothetical protein